MQVFSEQYFPKHIFPKFHAGPDLSPKEFPDDNPTWLGPDD